MLLFYILLPARERPSFFATVHSFWKSWHQFHIKLGRVAEQMGNLEHALSAYENALRHNAMSLPGLTQVAGIARIKENYPKVRDRVR